MKQDSGPVSVLNALLNETNRAKNGRTVAEISVIYYKHMVYDFDKMSSVGLHIAGHFFGLLPVLFNRYF